MYWALMVARRMGFMALMIRQDGRTLTVGFLPLVLFPFLDAFLRSIAACDARILSRCRGIAPQIICLIPIVITQGERHALHRRIRRRRTDHEQERIYKTREGIDGLF